MGIALSGPLTSYKTIYTLPMLTIKADKGREILKFILKKTVIENIKFVELLLLCVY